MSKQWDSRIESLDGRKHRCVILHGGQAATFADVLHGWERDEAFRSYFTSILATAPFAAFRWETPPVERSSVDRGFEFVVMESPQLDRSPEPDVFDEQIGNAREPAVAFANLSGDAT